MTEKFTFLKLTDPMPDSCFIKTPRNLIFDKCYSHISAMAKYLLIIMLERQDLSYKNKWADKDGNVYIIVTHEEARELLGCSESKVKKLFSELTQNNFIKRKRQGLCKPDLIYVNPQLWITSNENNTPKVTDETVMKDADEDSGQFENNIPEGFKEAPNKNNNIKNNIINNNININHNNLSYAVNSLEWMEDRKECTEFIKDIIAYNCLLESCDKGIIDDIVTCAVNALCTTKPTMKIGGEDIPKEAVKRMIYKLDYNVAEYIHDSLKNTQTVIKNPPAYLLTAIYKAGETMSIAG